MKKSQDLKNNLYTKWVQDQMLFIKLTNKLDQVRKYLYFLRISFLLEMLLLLGLLPKNIQRKLQFSNVIVLIVFPYQ